MKVLRKRYGVLFLFFFGRVMKMKMMGLVRSNRDRATEAVRKAEQKPTKKKKQKEEEKKKRKKKDRKGGNGPL